jgi:PAS domain S-box-containing protein
MKSNLDPYIIELESKILILERENEILSAKAEENLLLNRAFKEINVYDDTDNLLLSTLEGISVLLNVQFSGIFDLIDGNFVCRKNYALFSNEDNNEVLFKTSENILKLITSDTTCFLKISNADFSFYFRGSDFVADNAVVVRLNSQIEVAEYFVFINDISGGNLAERIPLFKMVVQIISNRLERVYFQNELKNLNNELEKKVELRTLLLKEQNKEFEKLNEEYKKNNLELKIAKERAEESELRFKALHNASFGGIAIHDKGKILDCNQGLSEISGYTQDELIGMDGLLLIGESFRDLVLKNILSGYEKDYEAIGVRKNGEEFPIRIEGRNIPYKGRKVRVTEFRDYTEKKIAETELIKAKEKAEESDKLKSAFLANMSHEIRTPMNGIMGFASLLKEPDLTGEMQQEYIKIIEKSGMRMLNIINDIVDISKIEAGLMNVDIKDININEKIDFIYIFFKPQVEEKGMKLICKNTLPSDQLIIRSDNEKIYSILTNLVKNAIKYSIEGEIEVGYSKKGDYLEFYVKDTGIGIPKDRQEAIFERFIQADISDKMALQGAGLGLSISKAYVEMLGGKIWVESEVGKGSVFYFTLPYITGPNKIAVEEKVVPSSETELAVPKLKVLISDDDETSEMLISLTIKDLCKKIIKSDNGNDTIEICRDNPDLDLILMDIQMPGINGYEATRQIRQFNNKVVIIAQTAFALSSDRQKVMDAGCNDYISKPVRKEELFALIKKYFTN